jgi:hypothetical protein
MDAEPLNIKYQSFFTHTVLFRTNLRIGTENLEGRAPRARERLPTRPLSTFDREAILSQVITLAIKQVRVVMPDLISLPRT